MSRTLIEISDRIAIDPAAITVVATHKNVRPWRCPQTGQEYDAHLRLETYHDVYRMPFATIDEAQKMLRFVAAAMRQANERNRTPGAMPPRHAASAASLGASDSRSASRPEAPISAATGRLREAESVAASKDEAA